ncbi:hypothetical protein P353_22735 [Comamonas testosteroni]|uniref:Uncharacterized protein n=1 Tax=Comamonas testosteroni TaxID=285 RepID=A0A096F784_COMTE|nr:hypothetical protein P353_22735 [Comamonas testosteroni]
MSIRSHEAVAAAACQPPSVNVFIKLLPVTQAVFAVFPIVGAQSAAALRFWAWSGIFVASSLQVFLPQGVRHA